MSWLCSDFVMTKKKQDLLIWHEPCWKIFFYSVTKGFLCTTWLQNESQAVNNQLFKNNFVRQKVCDNTVIIRMHLSQGVAVQLQTVDKRQRRNSCTELTLQYCICDLEVTILFKCRWQPEVSLPFPLVFSDIVFRKRQVYLIATESKHAAVFRAGMG